jgi:hypothetical protein
MRFVALLALAGCGGTKPITPDEAKCPIEMSIDPSEPTTSAPMTVRIAEETGAQYTWTVSGGTIASGQGTATIVVEGAPAGAFSATVALRDYGLYCPPTATASTTVR